MICNKCGNAVEHNAYFCDKCGNQVRKETVQMDKSQLKGMALWEENYLFGSVGALLGGVAGIVIYYQWFMFFTTQFLVPIPGAIMGGLIVGGYWWLGKRIRGVGTAICAALALVAGWLANHIFWAMVVYTNGAIETRTYWSVFFELGWYMEHGLLELGYYVMGLISTYFGALIGVSATVGLHRTLVKD